LRAFSATFSSIHSFFSWPDRQTHKRKTAIVVHFFFFICFQCTFASCAFWNKNSLRIAERTNGESATGSAMSAIGPGQQSKEKAIRKENHCQFGFVYL
jgi:hypothetical protein